MPSVKVAKTTEVPAGQGLVVQAGTKVLALFNVEGSYHAIHNRRPQRCGPMGEGDLDGRVAVCPWHGWRWDVTTGANANNPAVKIACFPTRVMDGDVYVELPGYGTPSRGPCGTCGCPSPTAATCAASTACRRRSTSGCRARTC